MNWLAMSLAIALHSGQQGPIHPTKTPAWRVVDTASVHVGLRPALIVARGEIGFGFTVQVSLYP